MHRAVGPQAGGRGRLWLAGFAVLLSLPALAQTPDSPAALRLASPVRPAKEPASVFIVKLRQPGAATYKGGTAGFAATKPAPGRKLDSSTSAVKSYVAHLQSSHDRVRSAERRVGKERSHGC